MKNKGFTLIELIVVIAVLAIITTIGVPRYLDQTKEANLTKHKNNIKLLEDASERYYASHNDWPRLSDIPYSSEELKEFSTKLIDFAGTEIEIDPNGKYYDIDYKALSKYIKTPKEDQKYYILRNPIGKVYYLENLTEAGQKRGLSYGKIDYNLDKYNTIIYIDAINGSDEAGDGSEDKPYKTLEKAIQYYDGYTAFVMGEGVYNSVNLNNSKYTEPLSFIGKGSKTIFRITGTLTSDIPSTSAYTKLNTNLYFYNLVWDGNNLGGTNFIPIISTWEFNNVVFENIGNCTYSYFMPSDKYGTNKSAVYMNNCVKTEETKDFLRTDVGEIKLTNCYGAFTSGYSTYQSSWDYQTNIITNNPNLDSEYNILDEGWQNTGTGLNPDGTQAHIGVYGGQYAWPK